MSRLNYMSDMELAILTIQEELACVERHASSGERLGTCNLAELKDLQGRLQAIIKEAEVEDTPTWETDDEACPDWLQPKTVTIEDEQEQTMTRPA